MTRRSLIMLLLFAIFLSPILARAALYAMSSDPRSWRDADWSSTGLLPAASAYKPARVIVFTGKAGAWKGVFAVHSWIVLKHANASNWKRYDVVGWGNPVRADNWPPDGRWYGNTPVAIADISGAQAEAIIPKIEAAVRDYGYAHAGDYRVWPGPNSNSFTAAVLRAVPELGVALPPNAVGRDYRGVLLCGADRQPHRHRAQCAGHRRAENRLGRGRRGRPARTGGRARSAPSGHQAAGIWPHRRRIAGDDGAGALTLHEFLTADLSQCDLQRGDAGTAPVAS